jgi:hypothetical protein
MAFSANTCTIPRENNQSKVHRVNKKSSNRLRRSSINAGKIRFIALLPDDENGGEKRGTEKFLLSEEYAAGV